MSRFKWLGVGGLILTLMTGCVNIDYVGQRFEPLPEDTFIPVYETAKAVPENTYQTIGKATLTAPDGSRWFDLREDLIEKARAVGADAIVLASARKVVVGATPELSPAAQAQFENSRDRTSLAPDGSYLYTDSFGQPVTVVGSVRDVYELQLQARFLMKRERFEQLMKARATEMEE